MLHLLRASAGAGKTHQLVQIYLAYILASPERIPHVVVLSFTNKATQELKERILAQLHALAEGAPTAMKAALQQKLSYDEPTLRACAKQALDYLLHHYHDFAIYTIDTFFQTLLRAFSYELGMPSTYQLLLEQNQLIDHCTKELLQQLPQTPALQETLVELAMQKIAEGKPWHLTQALTRWSHDLLATFNDPLAPAISSNMPSSELITLLKNFAQEAADFERTLASKATEILQHVKQAGLTAQDFAWGERGVIGFLKKLQHKTKGTLPSQRIRQAGLDPAAWISKKSPHATQTLDLVTHTLQPLLADILSFYTTHYTYYATLQTLLMLRYRIMTTQALKQRILAHTHQHEAVLIHTVPYLIKTTLEGTSNAFLAAKTGHQPFHFLIDESQDLSTAQWQAIAPLLQQTVQAHRDSWLVGDAKQAIYRWRGGNPQLLLTQVEEEIGHHHTQVSDLQHNWRSQPTIVNFNNAFFDKAAQLITSSLQAALQPQTSVDNQALHAEIAHIQKAYGQVKQQLPPSTTTTEGGYIEVGFIPSHTRGNAWKKEAIERTIHTIEDLQQAGYARQDITLLVRHNAEAQLLLQALLQHKKSDAAKPDVRYEAVTSAALSLGASPYIKLLISALRYLHRPDDQVALATVVHLYQQHVKAPLGMTKDALKTEKNHFLAFKKSTTAAPFLPAHFFEKCAKLKSLSLYPLIAQLLPLFDIEKVCAPSYLHAFKDVVHTFSLRQENSLPDFLRWWAKYGVQEVAAAPAAEDAMTIMTIHQSKGLGFKAVIIPFCAWELDHSPYNLPMIACKTLQPPFDQLGTLPLSYRAQLQDTYYAAAYTHEQWQQYLEQLNLLYVSFTRARDACYVFTPHVKTTSLKTTAHVLNHLLQPDATHPQGAMHAQGRWDEETLSWYAGTLPKPSTPAAKLPQPTSQNTPTFSTAYDPHKHITQRILTTHQQGIWWHDLFSKITTVASAHPAVDHEVKTQRISPSQGAQVKSTLDRLFQDPRLQDWFSDRWQVHAERSITLPSGTLWRPDRVMTRDNKAIVLDFKLGSLLPAHHKQVRTYIDLVAQLGYTQVKGYLLSLSEERLVEVVYKMPENNA